MNTCSIGESVDSRTRRREALVAGDVGMAAGSAPGPDNPVGVSAALAAASGAPALLATLPWVSAYLTFLPRHPAAAATPYFRCSSAVCAHLSAQ